MSTTDIAALDSPDGNEEDGRYDDLSLDYRDNPVCDDAEPCGENMCHCDHVPQHGPCGCDCPRSYEDDDDGQGW